MPVADVGLMMIASAMKLFGEVLSGRAAPQALVYRTRDRLDRWMGAASRRFEFERLYSDGGDVWGYATSRAEQGRYRQTLDCILAHRRGAEAVLEIGCSVGIFTGWLAEHFARVIALDVSREALRLARANNSCAGNITFVAEDIRRWKVKDKFDVILGCDVLYYLREVDGERVCDQIDKGLAADGLIVTATGIAWGAVDPDVYFDDWDSVLGRRFRPIYESDVMDETRPYRIVAFARR
jgi:SAM-dependent methyltransferase